MKIRIPALTIVFICSLGGSCRDHAMHSGSGSMKNVGWWADVSANGKRYYGIAIEASTAQGGKEVSLYSSVVLSPWDDRADITVSLKGDVTTFTLKEGPIRILGRHVCIADADGTSLMILPAIVPVEAYQSREKLEAAIAQIIQRAEQAAPHDGDKPSN